MQVRFGGCEVRMTRSTKIIVEKYQGRWEVRLNNQVVEDFATKDDAEKLAWDIQVAFNVGDKVFVV